MLTTIDLPDEQAGSLMTLAEQLQVPSAELVRRAVAEYLDRHPPPNPDAAFGLWRSRGEDGLAYQSRLRAEWPD